MGELASLVDSMQWWHWALLAMVLLLAELAAPGEFFIWIAAAAGVVAVATLVWPAMPWAWQFIAFAILSVFCLFLLRGYFARRPITTDEPLLNRRGDSHIGHVYTLAEPIENGIGSVSIGDTRWRVSGNALPGGRAVRVTGVDGSTLKVEPAEDIEPGD